ncbi:hypothetical protein K2F43_00880 [Clostridium estertheticum]|uniref:hypothetical protein n=1 Tax=Clostridium estertheticum TaxID=238834 RepID=UPI001C6ECB08|nr:hypothetical protein [Clostridium estertheticum]MBW9169755.1 hypothetical protein [Clostridium estertheticum]WLC74739.1 hypothetical protein KTC99_18585 [Clostridium estertheticum]
MEENFIKKGRSTGINMENVIKELHDEILEHFDRSMESMTHAIIDQLEVETFMHHLREEDKNYDLDEEWDNFMKHTVGVEKLKSECETKSVSEATFTSNLYGSDEVLLSTTKWYVSDDIAKLMMMKHMSYDEAVEELAMK